MKCSIDLESDEEEKKKQRSAMMILRINQWRCDLSRRIDCSKQTPTGIITKHMLSNKSINGICKCEIDQFKIGSANVGITLYAFE